MRKRKSGEERRKVKVPQQIKTCKRKTLDDEFFTMYKDCVRELHKYDLRGRKIICPCDTKESNIYRYLKDCYYDVKCDSKEWCNVDYSRYDLVVTNPPFSQVREFIRYLVQIKIDFIIIVSDVLRYSIKQGKFDLGIPIYKGWDAQKFYRPDGTIRPIHCGWIASFQDTWNENKILKDDIMNNKEIYTYSGEEVGEIEKEYENKIAVLERALELAVADKCKYENLMVEGIVSKGAKVAVPKKEQWYKEQAESDIKNDKE